MLGPSCRVEGCQLAINRAVEQLDASETFTDADAITRANRPGTAKRTAHRGRAVPRRRLRTAAAVAETFVLSAKAIVFLAGFTTRADESRARVDAGINEAAGVVDEVAPRIVVSTTSADPRPERVNLSQTNPPSWFNHKPYLEYYIMPICQVLIPF